MMNLVSMECVEHTQRLIVYHVVDGYSFACWLLVVYHFFYNSFLLNLIHIQRQPVQKVKILVRNE